jgi:DNA repair protein RadD
MTDLRPYQNDVIADFEREIAKGNKRILLVSPTGSGKTVIGSAIIGHYSAQHKGSLVLAHRREIVAQTHKKLAENGIRAGIIQAGVDPRPLERVQVASIQTLWVRAFRSSTMLTPVADLLVIDECHHAPAETYRKIIESYPEAILLGLTATPCRGDGRGLGGIFETMVECPQVPALIELGYLVPSRVYAPVDPDLRGVETRKGDYVESQLGARMDRAELVGDIVTHWHKFGEKRRTVVFAVNVAHSLHIRDEFCRQGVRAEHIDGDTPADERDATLARLESGEIEVVTNCMVLTEGWDQPAVSCCILARPTKKMGLYRQMVGRVLRPAPNKTEAIIRDHSGAVFRHGLPEDRVEWTLDEDTKATSQAHTARSQKLGGGLIECTQCSALRQGGKPCPCCGFMPRRPAHDVSIRAGDLGLVKGGKAKANEYNRDEWHAMLAYIGEERGYKRGWASVQFKEKFGQWPPWGPITPLPPSPEVRSWIQSRQIAYRKAMAKRARR